MHVFAKNPSANPSTPSRGSKPIRSPGFGQTRTLYSNETADNGNVLAAPLRHSPGTARILTKLEINEPGDGFEREADRVADQVMRMVEPSGIGSTPVPIQRKCAACEKEEEETSGPRAVMQGIAGTTEEDTPFSQPTISRKAQLAAPPDRSSVPAPIAGGLLSGRSRGEPLSEPVRNGMEDAFGHDFSRVRIHRDAEAGEMTRQLGALAFTHRSHIYFDRGRYDPHASSGKWLLAHELTHVVQQGHAASGGRSRAVANVSSSASSPAIQRFALWRAGTVNEVNNLADGVINGGPAGFTPPMLNGAIILSTAQARAAIRRPTLSFSPAAAGGINAKVDNTPINTGSFEEDVLAPGPWTTVAPKAAVGGLLPALGACTGAGDSTFRAIGDPSDAAMHAANRRQEDRHAADNEVAYRGSLVPWDSNLIVAEVLEEEFNGPTQADAEAALWARMGGTPDQVADNYFNEAARLGRAFHGTPAGGTIGAPTDPLSNADCSTSSAKFTNPS
jgi:hypothetical protein